MSPELAALAEQEYVRLTTYRASGDPVGTPVWIAPDGDDLLVTTGAASGKVKRLAHTPTVELSPCDVRGTVPSGAVPVVATAVVDDSAATRDRVAAAMKRKYGLKYRILDLGNRLRGGSNSVSLVIRP